MDEIFEDIDIEGQILEQIPKKIKQLLGFDVLDTVKVSGKKFAMPLYKGGKYLSWNKISGWDGFHKVVGVGVYKDTDCVVVELGGSGSMQVFIPITEYL